MSVIPNFAGNFMGTGAPVANYPAFGSPFGTFIKPGGKVAAYVRSTGAQDGDELFTTSGLLVASINEGLKRCRSGLNDIVFVLPGHTETYSTSGAVWANLVAGAQIIGCGVPGSSNNPTITLANAGASVALNVANCTVAGINITSTTAALTGAIAITGAGATLAGNYILSTGALAANHLIALTGVANVDIIGNLIVGDTTTGALLNITGAGATNFVIAGNLMRQAQGTSGGVGIAVANAACTGWIHRNLIQTATNGVPASLGITVGAAALPGVGTFENYCSDAEGGSGLITPAANDGN